MFQYHLPWQSAMMESNEQCIGFSEEGRPLCVTYLGKPTAPLRVLLLAGQHGNETPAIQAASALIISYDQQATRFPAIHLAVLPCVNPDGAARHQRRNSHAVDLNRDHQQLQSAEVQALHQFVRSWRPHLVIDLHTTPAHHKERLPSALLCGYDLLLDVPTHPAIHHAWPAALPTLFLDTLILRLNQMGYRTNRYPLLHPLGMVRHGAPTLADARNGLALRYDPLTLLLSGRQLSGDDSVATRNRLLTALQSALETILLLAQQQHERLCAPTPLPRPGDCIPIRTRCVRVNATYILFLPDSETKRPHAVARAGPYLPLIKPKRYTILPAAYAVPQSDYTLLATLQRHGFFYQTPSARTMLHVRRVEAPPMALAQGKYQQTVLTNHLLFPTAQVGGRALALFLEPDSPYRLTKQPHHSFNQPHEQHDALLRVCAYQ